MEQELPTLAKDILMVFDASDPLSKTNRALYFIAVFVLGWSAVAVVMGARWWWRLLFFVANFAIMACFFASIDVTWRITIAESAFGEFAIGPFQIPGATFGAGVILAIVYHVAHPSGRRRRQRRSRAVQPDGAEADDIFQG